MKLHDLNLIHYSAKPLTAIMDAASRPNPSRDEYFKPTGLWVSVRGEDDWKSWCESESLRPETLQCETQITLAANANVLHLEDEDDIDRFTAKYTLRPPRYTGDRSIDWPRVAEDFDGIIIAPYCWPRRMAPHTFWYYGWDCASGCIWRARAVALLIQIPMEVSC